MTDTREPQDKLGYAERVAETHAQFGSMRRSLPFDDKKKAVFIDALKEGLSYAGAANRAGISRSTAIAHREKDPEFAKLVYEAVEEGTDSLEDEMHQRAMTVSDTLMIFSLKSRRPEKYREKYEISHNHKVEHRHVLDIGALDQDQLEQLAKIFSAGEPERVDPMRRLALPAPSRRDSEDEG